MKKMKFNTIAARSIKTGLAIGALVAAQGAFACTVANWNGGNSGNVTAGGPNAGSIARYSGICAMATPDGVTAWVDRTTAPAALTESAPDFTCWRITQRDASQRSFIGAFQPLAVRETSSRSV